MAKHLLGIGSFIDVIIKPYLKHSLVLLFRIFERRLFATIHVLVYYFGAI